MTIAVGAFGVNSKKSSYSEQCSALMVVAPSSGGSHGIITCDIVGPLGYSPTECTSSFGGTSSAAPLAAGVVALMLSANPSLGWKDVHYILLSTAKRVDASDSSWFQNGVGRWVSHKYGYGLLDSAAVVEAALNYSSYLKTKLGRHASAGVTVNADLVDGQPLVSKTSVSYKGSCEQVQIIVSASHPDATELTIRLTSPSGTTSVLARMRGFSLVFQVASGASSWGAIPAEFSSALAFPERSLAVANIKGFSCDMETLLSNNTGVDIRGKVALVRRGECFFREKALTLQQAGAAVVLVYNDAGDGAFIMAGGPRLDIPVAMISSIDGAVLQTLSSVTVSLLVSKQAHELRYRQWHFSSTFYWGEPAAGEWTLSVADEYDNPGSNSQGRLTSWSLIIWNNDGNDTGTTSNGGGEEVDKLTEILLMFVFGVALIVLIGGAILVFRRLQTRHTILENSGGDAGGQMENPMEDLGSKEEEEEERGGRGENEIEEMAEDFL